MPEITGNSLSQGQKTKGNTKTPNPRKGETMRTGIWKSMGWLDWRLYAQSMDYTQNPIKLVLTGN